MEEITCNIHMHTTYSDGFGTYSTIIDAAAQAGLDVVIITDHNVWVNGLEGYYSRGKKRVLVLTGEEVHNQDRFPQKNHMLVLGAESEVAIYASVPQELIDTIHQKGGLSFLAHPDEVALELVHEDDISWVDWETAGYTGFELWNNFSELKTVSHTPFQLLLNVLDPSRIATSPSKATLERWDSLLTQGRHLSVIGGADAHALRFKIGPITKTIFPYQYHFSAINNHLLLPEPLSGNLQQDKKMIYNSLAKGSSFIGYDLPASTRGFTFSISNEEYIANPGDTITLFRGATIQVKLPAPAEINLIKDGVLLYSSRRLDHLAYPITEPGAYRVECKTEFMGKLRGWIYSNPIYVVKEN
jgi:tRNA(Leu) C34 or U34 (ribose-2'-O)-methylase TrmL